MNDPVIDLRGLRGAIYCHHRDDYSWPTMLGLLTIISDAIAAAPWWGSGESKPVLPDLPQVGSLWADRMSGDLVTVTSHGRSLGGDDLVYQGAWFWKAADFHERYFPATVVPTPTADDWIDPAVRLPDVGEWYWWLNCNGDGLQAFLHYDGDDTWPGGSWWAPILVGPPPIPDASEVE